MSSYAMTTDRWEKMLSAWSETEGSPEKKLIVAVLAAAINDEKKSHAPFKGPFFAKGGGMSLYANAIDLDHGFVMRMIERAAIRRVELEEAEGSQ